MLLHEFISAVLFVSISEFDKFSPWWHLGNEFSKIFIDFHFFNEIELGENIFDFKQKNLFLNFSILVKL